MLTHISRSLGRVVLAASVRSPAVACRRGFAATPAGSKPPPYDYKDPFNLDGQLTEEELMVQQQVHTLLGRAPYVYLSRGPS